MAKGYYKGSRDMDALVISTCGLSAFTFYCLLRTRARWGERAFKCKGVDVGKGQFLLVMSDVARELGMSKSTAHKMINDMVSIGCIKTESMGRAGTLVTVIGLELPNDKPNDSRTLEASVSGASGRIAERLPNDEPNADNRIEEQKKRKEKTIAPASAPYAEIIEYLNQQTGRSYKHSAQATRRHIKARWNEGYRLADFIKVIDVKVKAWSDDSKMAQYLRPETLFGSKFDRYLNEQPDDESPDTLPPAQNNHAFLPCEWEG